MNSLAVAWHSDMFTNVPTPTIEANAVCFSISYHIQSYEPDLNHLPDIELSKEKAEDRVSSQEQVAASSWKHGRREGGSPGSRVKSDWLENQRSL